VTDELASVECEQRDGRLLLGLRGEVDLSNVDRLQQRIERAVEGAEAVVIDLTEVDYIDSQGLRLLKRVEKKLADSGSALEIVAPPASVARSVLDLTGLTAELSVRDAISS
jgi:anti-sigma B factor antagonist